ncbi:MAG: nucleotidyltransferase domain-containing protein [Saccharolobus sp.]
MERRYFLDRDLIIDKLNNIYTIFTNYNPPGYVFAYLKYIYTGKGLWRGYERVFKQYGVHNLIKIQQENNFEYCYDAPFPIVYLSNIKKHIKPEEELNRLLKRSINDDVVLALIDFVENYVKVKDVGVTGSIALGIHHENSDIDIIIYGCKNALDFIESFEGFKKDEQWIIETNTNYGIDYANLLYDNKRRGIYKGRKISVLFVYDKPWKYCEEVCKKKGKVRFRATVLGDCQALFYPSIALVISKNEYRVSKIISYEGIFSLALFGRKEVMVEGMLMECQEENVVIIGDREVRGFIRPL